jgi:hypothetical protein
METALPVAGGLDAVALEREKLLEHPGQLRVVLDDEHGRRRSVGGS